MRFKLNDWRMGPALALAGLAILVVAAVVLEYTSSEPGPESSGEEYAAADLSKYAMRLTESGDPYFGTRQLDYLIRQLDDATFDTDTWRLTILRRLAFHRLRLGQVDESIRLLTEAAELAERIVPDSREHQGVLEELAVAHMKRGEIQNCVVGAGFKPARTGRLVCALPLDPTYSHSDTDSVSRAIEILDGLLVLNPDDVRRRWLLNIAHMARGTYPEGVSESFRVPPSAFAPEHDLGGRFREVAADVGIYSVDLAGGAIVEDFDNDGLLDIVTSSWDPSQSLRLYRNSGNGRFVERTNAAGLSEQTGGLNIVQADYDNDGWMDILVMRGGWLMSNGQMRVSLLRNDGDGSFSDVTHESGLATPAFPSQSASWADYDNDGDLDLFSCNESIPESLEESSAIIFPSQLYENDGKGVFTDVAVRAGVTNLRYCKGSTWGDYDNDGDQDLYLSNYATENRLYRNNGDGTFTDVARDLGVTEPGESFPTWFWDYDNDGWLDLFVAGYARDIDSVAADYLGLPNSGPRPRLYRNLGASEGTSGGSRGFTDVAALVGLDDVNQSMGSNFGDFDNDGYPDMYLGTGFPAFNALAPNVAYRNDEGESFSNVTFSAGLGHIQKGHGIAFGDLDRDGDQDIFVQVGGFYPSDGFVNSLYVNPGAGNRWTSIRLIGTRSNRSAIGARIRVNVTTSDGPRAIHALVSSGGSFGASSMEQEMGLGQAEAIDSIEVWWPASGTRQRFEGLPLDTTIKIVEGDDKHTVVDRPGFEFQP